MKLGVTCYVNQYMKGMLEELEIHFISLFKLAMNMLKGLRPSNCKNKLITKEFQLKRFLA